MKKKQCMKAVRKRTSWVRFNCCVVLSGVVCISSRLLFAIMFTVTAIMSTVTGVWSIVAGGVTALAMMHRVARLHVCLAFILSIGNSTPTCFSLTEKGAGAGRSSTQQRGSHFMKKNRSLSHSWLEYPRCNRDWRSCAPCLEKTQCCACERRASQPPF